MIITKEAILKRLEQLKKEQDQLRGNLNAYNGAIQDCEYWLSQIEEKDEQDNVHQIK